MRGGADLGGISLWTSAGETLPFNSQCTHYMRYMLHMNALIMLYTTTCCHLAMHLPAQSSISSLLNRLLLRVPSRCDDEPAITRSDCALAASPSELEE